MKHRDNECQYTIMIVDDDQALAEMLSIVLEGEGFRAVVCHDGLRAVELFPLIQPDLVLLDVMLPGLTGVEVAQKIRIVSVVPIIMLTAKSDTMAVVEGLEAGADDYVSKPFKVAELLARIRTRLRRITHQSGNQEAYNLAHIERDGLVMDRSQHTVSVYGHNANLTPLEFDLLFLLASNENEVISRTTLLKEVWGYADAGDTRLVSVHIQRLRAKVEKDPEHPDFIHTVRGIGYKFCTSSENIK